MPVAVPSGTEKSLTVMVMQPPFGFGVEVVEKSGRVLAAASSAIPSAAANLRPNTGVERVNVLLLSSVVDAVGPLKAALPHLAKDLDVTQLREAREVPDAALHLAGLGAVVIDDFDAASLSGRQRRALQDYVSLGGSLVLTGGSAWSRTLESLPPGLAPLRASGSAVVSMGPLADLVAGSTTASAEVATGEVTAGRVVVAVPGGPPLVVESDYRAGRVVQLTYDPQAEPIASDPLLQGIAWDMGLGRLVPRSYMRWDHDDVAEDQLWSSSLGGRPWPSWARLGVGLLVAYALVLGPVAFLLSRRARPVAGLVTIPLAVVLACGAVLSLGGIRGGAHESVVDVHTPGADGTVLTTSYRGMFDHDPPGAVAVGPGAASTVFSDRPVFARVDGLADQTLSRTLPNGGWSPVARGRGGGAVLAGGQRPAVRLAARAWELRTLQTVSVAEGGPDLDAALHLDGASASSPGRVKGTVTNRGAVPVRQPRAQIKGEPEGINVGPRLGGQARLGDVVFPGETMQVDAPIVPLDLLGSDPRLVPTDEEVAMFAAADRALSAPDRIAVFGLTQPTANPAGALGTEGELHRIGVVVTVVRLEDPASTRARARLVSDYPWSGNSVAASPSGTVAVAELEVSSRAGPLSIRYPLYLGGPVAELSYEVYNWATGAWRALPGRSSAAESGTSPLEQAEVNQGLVRFRARSSQEQSVRDRAGGGVIHPQAHWALVKLLPSSTSG
ncbi:MAG: hypothetical protein WKF86_08940 [Acidimicrobiales bacterium]